MELKRPRVLLRSILDKPSSQNFRECRPHMQTPVACIESASWTEIKTPHVMPDGQVIGAPGEELMFIERMTMVGNGDLSQSVVESVGTNFALQQERDEQKRTLNKLKLIIIYLGCRGSRLATIKSRSSRA